MQIGIIGMGKLGTPLASVFAQAGHRIICVDVLREKIDLINEHQNPISAEPNVIITENMVATSDYDQLGDCEIIFVVVNTPPLSQGNLNLTDLENTCYKLKDALGTNVKGVEGHTVYHRPIIVISSTVPPKTMEWVQETLKPIPVVYNPFFIALGQVVHDLQWPDIVLIGGDDIPSRHRIAELWAESIGFYRGADLRPALRDRICETNLKTAELVKFSSNPYLVMRINWANTVARLAEVLGDVDAQEVIDIIGKDKRANTEGLRVGLPWGGDCFPKDIDAVTYFCNSEGIDGLFFEGLAEVNQHWKESLPGIIMDKVCRSDFRNAKIAFLGISYKKSYPLLSRSTAYELYEYFVREEARVFVHDPYIEKLPDGSKTYALEECLADAEMIIIAVGYPEYAKLSMHDLPYHEVPIVDLCRVLANTNIASQGNWLPLGLRE